MVLIASCYYQENYGSKLQAYATQAFLDSIGVENYTINFSNINDYINNIKIKYYIKHIYKTDAFIAQFKRYIFKFNILKNHKLKENFKIRKLAMNSFSENNFNLTLPIEYGELNKLCYDMKANAVIVGSDQLWLPSNIYADYYTLNFVPDNIKRISYATSFGVSSLDKAAKKSAKIFLNKFDSISVREKQGENIVYDLIGKSAKVVCDPTMFFKADEWCNILNIKPLVDDKYIFCYFLGDNLWHREWAVRLREITGLKIVSLIHLEKYNKYDKNYYDKALFDVAPNDFIGLIQNAEYICTDSFHGTVFSLLFHKKFYLFRRFKETHSASTNSRIDSLIKPLHLTDRIICKTSAPEDKLNLKINYSEIDVSIENLRKESIAWLKNALGVN